MEKTKEKARLAIDIGGTFTDLCLERNGKPTSVKVLTTPRAPEEGVLAGMEEILQQTGVQPAELGLIIHGTTLATNAIIERKGARTALVVTEGFRDSIEIAFENRFEQYDIFMQKPAPLVPRELRFGVPERLDGRGNVLLPLDEAAVRALAPQAQGRGRRSGRHRLHARLSRRPARARARATSSARPAARPVDHAVERGRRRRSASTSAGRPRSPTPTCSRCMDRYLGRLDTALRAKGVACPLFLMTSGGGLAALETARQFPDPPGRVRARPAAPSWPPRWRGSAGSTRCCSFDMGGTTAKICLIDDGEPQHSRTFEVARQYRFLKGSGLPLRIPVIEMVEIGAGGGSIASVDALSRIKVGPESAGAEPGPASYGRGGSEPTVTDADVVLGRIDPGYFAGGTIELSPDKAGAAIEQGGRRQARAEAPRRGVRRQRDRRGEHGQRRARARRRARQGAAGAHPDRVRRRGADPRRAAGREARHRAHPGAERRRRRLGARLPDGAGRLRGGAQPLRAARRGQVRSRPTSTRCSPRCGRRPRRWCKAGAPDARLAETRTADMRYRGQGHEIAISLPAGRVRPGLARRPCSRSSRRATPRRSAAPSPASTSRS